MLPYLNISKSGDARYFKLQQEQTPYQWAHNADHANKNVRPRRHSEAHVQCNNDTRSEEEGSLSENSSSKTCPSSSESKKYGEVNFF